MTEITLSKTETRLLTGAAERGGAFEIPETTKPSTRERLLGRLLRDELITSGEAGHLLTPAGYRAVGLKPPRTKRSEAARVGGVSPLPRATKGTLILQLLGRGEGASLSELIDATGWLPHTTRAALSRLRSGGKPLAKSKRDDGTTSYRILMEEPAPPRRSRTPRAEAAATAAA